MSRRLYRTLQALCLICLSLFLFDRIWSGRLTWYIHSRFLPLTLVGAVGAAILARALLDARPPAGAGAPAEPGDPASSSEVRALVLLALPLVLGLLVPAQPLSAASIPNRGLSVSAPLRAAGESAPIRFDLASTDRTVLDWLRSYAANPDPASFDGQQADVVGFVYHDPRLPTGQFLLARFTLTCCVADASAIGLLVDWPEAQALPADTWVRVRGLVYGDALDGQPIPRLAGESVEIVPAPDEPYLYP